MRKLLLSLASAVCLLSTQAVAAPKQKVKMINDTYAPFVLDAKHKVGPGIDVEIAKKALENAGYDVDFEIVPWGRVLKDLELGKADLTTTLSFKEERDSYLDWSEPYRKTTTYVFFMRKDDNRAIKSFDDIKPLTVGAVKKFTYPDEIETNKDLKLTRAKDLSDAAQMLLKKRVDVVIANSVQGVWELREAGLLDQLRTAEFELLSEDRGRGTMMGFSKKRKQKEILDAFNQELKKMIESGEFQAIHDKYLKQ